jgi:hypothetical protein
MAFRMNQESPNWDAINQQLSGVQASLLAERKGLSSSPNTTRRLVTNSGVGVRTASVVPHEGPGSQTH